MTYKKLIGIIFLSFLICNYSISEETIFNYSSDSTYGNDGRVSGNVGKIDVGVAVEKAKKLCKNLGFFSHIISLFNSGKYSPLDTLLKPSIKVPPQGPDSVVST